MNAEIDIQLAVDATLPSEDVIQRTVDCTLAYMQLTAAELTIRFVSADESQMLNRDYRGKDKPTNVLSFPSDIPAFIPSDLLGDLVICSAVVEQEAKRQSKDLNAHYQHLIVHGCLHLLGLDHIDENEAETMEAKEIAILAQLGIDDPYQDQ